MHLKNKLEFFLCDASLRDTLIPFIKKGDPQEGGLFNVMLHFWLTFIHSADALIQIDLQGHSPRGK